MVGEKQIVCVEGSEIEGRNNNEGEFAATAGRVANFSVVAAGARLALSG